MNKIKSWFKKFFQEKSQVKQKRIGYKAKVELQVVMTDRTVMLSDYNTKSTWYRQYHESKESCLNEIANYIVESYNTGTISLIDKSNKCHTHVSTSCINRILYSAPKFEEVEFEV